MRDRAKRMRTLYPLMRGGGAVIPAELAEAFETGFDVVMVEAEAMPEVDLREERIAVFFGRRLSAEEQEYCAAELPRVFGDLWGRGGVAVRFERNPFGETFAGADE